MNEENNNALKNLKKDNKRIELLNKKTIFLAIIKSAQDYLAVILEEFGIYKEKRKDSYQEVILLFEEIKEMIDMINNTIINNKLIEEIVEKITEIDTLIFPIEILVEKCQLLTNCLFNVFAISKWKEEKRYTLLDFKHQLNQKFVAIYKSEKIKPIFLHAIINQISETNLINELIISWADTYDYLTADKKFKDEYKKQFLQEKFDITCKKLNNAREISLILLKNKLIEEKYQEQLKLLNNNAKLEIVNDISLDLTEYFHQKYTNLATIVNYDFDLKINVFEKAYQVSLEFLAGKINNVFDKELFKKRTIIDWFQGISHDDKNKVQTYLQETNKVDSSLLNEIWETASRLSQVPYIKK